MKKSKKKAKGKLKRMLTKCKEIKKKEKAAIATLEKECKQLRKKITAKKASKAVKKHKIGRKERVKGDGGKKLKTLNKSNSKKSNEKVIKKAVKKL